MAIDAETIVDRLIESIERTNYDNGKDSIIVSNHHRKEILEKSEHIIKLQNTLSENKNNITTLERNLSEFTWDNLTHVQKERAFVHFIQCFEGAVGEELTDEQKQNIQGWLAK